MLSKVLSVSLVGFLSFSSVAFAVLPADYTSMKAIEKQDLLWSEISQSEYSELPTKNPGTLDSLSLFSCPFLKTSFTRASDEMPEGRIKLIHTYGSVAKVELRIHSEMSHYTGIFKTGGIGFARLSLAREGGDYIPGMGLKILVDGKPSVNFQVMYALDGQGSNKNFFENPFTNIVAPPTTFGTKALSLSFHWASNSLSDNPYEKPENERTLPLLEAAELHSDGSPVEQAVAPYLITFIPNPKIAISKDSKRDLRTELQEIPANTVLYTISVKKSLDAPAEEIGELITRSNFIASEYGDSKLFFQHMSRRSTPN
jgi:hypothetical protein